MIREMKVERDRELLRDYFEYDKSKEQICRELELKPEHFDRVLFRARQRLKQIIQLKHGSISVNDSSLLGALILFGFLTIPESSPNFFTVNVGGKLSTQHLLYETPKTSSRYLPNSKQLGKQLTSNSRCV
jgi:RNA polymerase sigma-70 factor (ECF subfamily)